MGRPVWGARAHRVQGQLAAQKRPGPFLGCTVPWAYNGHQSLDGRIRGLSLGLPRNPRFK